MEFNNQSIEDQDRNDAKYITYGVIFSIVFLVLGLLCFLQVKDRQNWIETKGRIISYIEQDGWRLPHGTVRVRTKETVVYLKYVYVVNNQSYEGKKVEHCSPSKEWKDKSSRQKITSDAQYPITVYYNPKDFSESILEIPSADVKDYWEFLFLLVPGLYLVWYGYQRIKKRYV